MEPGHCLCTVGFSDSAAKSVHNMFWGFNGYYYVASFNLVLASFVTMSVHSLIRINF